MEYNPAFTPKRSRTLGAGDFEDRRWMNPAQPQQFAMYPQYAQSGQPAPYPAYAGAHFQAPAPQGSTSVPYTPLHQPGYLYDRPNTPNFPYGGYVPAEQTPWRQARPLERPRMERQDSDELELHPLLTKERFGHGSRYGSATALFDIRHKTVITSSGNKLMSSDKSALAFQPPQKKIRVLCKELPWDIVIENSKGVTIGDVFEQIHKDMQVNLTLGEWNITTDKDRARMIAAYRAGVSGSKRVAEEGVKRVDFLGTKTKFDGMRPLEKKDNDWASARLAVAGASTDGVFIMTTTTEDD